MWDPGQYRAFAAERARPFRELIARVDAPDPRLVVDLGCGPGELTAELSRKWPAAQVHGIDSSAEMIGAARQLLAAGHPGSADAGAATPGAARGSTAGCSAAVTGNLTFAVGDARDWRPDAPPDVVVCSAVLQWVPDHLRLLQRWAGQLAPGGWLAVQVPGNFSQPSQRLLRDLAASGGWRDLLAGVQLTSQDADPAEYLDLLARTGCAVDAWETTYLQVLQGTDPVLQWYLGAGLRPVLAALDSERAARFTAEYGALLREAYPAQPYGTVLAFRRIFAVARRG